MNRNVRHLQRRGTLYLIVLLSATFVSVVGLSGLLIVRARQKSAETSNDFVAARALAFAAVQEGVAMMNASSSWRTQLPAGAWISGRARGGGTISLDASDPNDGDIADSERDPVLLRGTGAIGAARYMLEASAVPVYQPYAALRTAVHAGGNVTTTSGIGVTVYGAPLSTNAHLQNSGTVYGDAEAATILSSGNVTGSVTVPAPTKDLPPKTVFDQYAALAKPVSLPSGKLETLVLSPAYNPGGAPSTDGVYLIDYNGHVEIRGARVHGTLLVRTHGNELRIREYALLHNARADYPTLLVDGDLDVDIDSSGQLTEAAYSTNFNPAGSPFLGEQDAEQLDAYPSELRGLVHVSGNVVMENAAGIQGTLLAGGKVDFAGYNWVFFNKKILDDTPVGYVQVAGMRIQPGSWRRIVDGIVVNPIPIDPIELEAELEPAEPNLAPAEPNLAPAEPIDLTPLQGGGVHTLSPD